VSDPLSPPPVTVAARNELPAYVSNGLVGLRVVDIPLLPGVVLVNGFSGMHPVVRVEAAAQAPYPIAGDISLNNVWLTAVPQQAQFVEQAYDFSCGELRTEFTYAAEGVSARIEVLTLCSRTDPTIVLQEVAVRVDEPCDLALRAIVDISKVAGAVADRDTASEENQPEEADGMLLWTGLGGRSRCGIAYVSELKPEGDAERKVLDWGLESALATQYTLRARPGRTYRMRQMASLVPSVMHQDPAREATRLVTRAASVGFDELRASNRREWQELWKSRVVIDSDDTRWQELADAAFFYLNSSAHRSAPSSTSIFGLAQWDDYHYYYGHVMWDIELFCVPPLILCQPDAARSILQYRSRTLDAAHMNAKLNGRAGLQYPWESGPLNGEESAPGSGKASWHEDHVSLDVAWAFAQFVHVTGDGRFLNNHAGPVIFGVADWIVSRVERRRTGYAWPRTMGIAERKEPTDNDAYTIMAALAVLRDAIALAERLGEPIPDAWREVASGLEVPHHSRTRAVMSHDDFRPNEEKGATPGPLAGIFPIWHPLAPDVAQATLDYYLRLAPGYIGSPMLSALYGVWACWSGDRRLALKLYEQGYAEMHRGRFLQALEQHPILYPDNPPAGPFFANLGGFLMGLMYGLPGLRLSPADPSTWPSREVILPAGWRSIEVERVWLRNRPARITAEHGAARAVVSFGKRRTHSTRPKAA